MDMLSTRLTGSSTSMISLSSRRAASTAVSAPGADMCARTNARLGSSASAYRSETTPAMSAWSRSKNRCAYVAIAASRSSPSSGGYQW